MSISFVLWTPTTCNFFQLTIGSIITTWLQSTYAINFSKSTPIFNNGPFEV